LRKTDKKHEDYSDLEIAVQEMEHVANYVNEQIRQFQNEQKLLEIYERGGPFDVHSHL
jgi:FKBP-type peptidyl-prolyl cis-trans isomerase (trigger factor)